MFPPSLWNLRERVLKGDPRTSNGMESFHSQLANSVQACHPPIWKLLEDLKNEVTLAEQKIDRFNVTGDTPRRNKTYKWRDIQYKNLASRYGEINDFDFLKSIATTLRLDKSCVTEEITENQ
jgi:hypothetical protein